MTADLVRAARLDADAQERGVAARGLARDLGKRVLPVQGRVDDAVQELEVAHRDRMVDLRHLVGLEDRHRRLERGVAPIIDNQPAKVFACLAAKTLIRSA